MVITETLANNIPPIFNFILRVALIWPGKNGGKAAHTPASRLLRQFSKSRLHFPPGCTIPAKSSRELPHVKSPLHWAGCSRPKGLLLLPFEMNILYPFPKLPAWLAASSFLQAEDLHSLTQRARGLLEAGLVFAVHDVKGQTRNARISLVDSSLYLHSLQAQVLPNFIAALQVGQSVAPHPGATTAWLEGRRLQGEALLSLALSGYYCTWLG